MKLSAADACDPGCTLDYNHDVARAFPDKRLFLVADGLGKGPGAGHASGLVADQFVNALEFPPPEDRERWMVHAAKRAAALLHLERLARPEFMATTLTAMHLDPAGWQIVHVGDSRAYRWRDGELAQLTNDHSVAWEQYRIGALTKEQAAQHPNQNMLTRVMNARYDSVVPELAQGDVRPGDRYLLCTDGLTKELGDGDLEEVFRDHDGADALCASLLEAAKSRGGRDNISIVTVFVE